MQLNHEIGLRRESPGEPFGQLRSSLAGDPIDEMTVGIARRWVVHAAETNFGFLVIALQRGIALVEPKLGVMNDSLIVEPELERAHIAI